MVTERPKKTKKKTKIDTKWSQAAEKWLKADTWQNYTKTNLKRQKNDQK